MLEFMATSRIREDDITLLLPSFQAPVQKLLDRMRDLGYSPILFDGLRTAAEALRNAKRGTGVVQSMHLYGCAADIICEDHLWSCKDKKCKFFTKLGQEAEALGLVWGGRFKKKVLRAGKWVVVEGYDQPHVQAIPVSAQNAMRALGVSETRRNERDELCRKYLPPAAG